MPTTVFDILVDNLSTTVGAAGRPAGGDSIPLAAGYGVALAGLLARKGYAGAPSAAQPLRVSLVRAAALDAADRLTDVPSETKFRVTGLDPAGDLLTGAAVIDGTPDQAFVAGDQVRGTIDAGHILPIQQAVNALEAGAAGPGTGGGPKRFLVPAPSGGDDAPAIQAAHDAAEAWCDASGRAAQLYFPFVGSGVYVLNSPVVIDASNIETAGDPGTAVNSLHGAYLIGFRRRIGVNGAISARHWSDLAPFVPDGSVPAAARYAIRSYDPAVEVVGTPGDGATFRLAVTVGTAGSATTSAVAADADAAAVAAALQAAVRTIPTLDGATVAGSGGPLGTAPVTYTLGGTLAGFLAPKLTVTGASNLSPAYVNCGQFAHPTFDSSPFGMLDPYDAAAPIKSWAGVRVLMVATAFSADWANIGRQPDGTFQSVGLCGLGHKSQPQPWRADYTNAAPGKFILTVNLSADYQAGTGFGWSVPINDKSQALQAIVWQLDLDAGTVAAWAWDGTLVGGLMHFVPQVVTGSTAGVAGGTLRDNCDIPFNVFGASSSSVTLTEFNGRLDDGWACGLAVSGAARFVTGPSGAMALASDGVTAPTFAQVFFSTDDHTLGNLSLTDPPGSIFVKGVGRSAAFHGVLANDLYSVLDETTGVTVGPHPRVANSSTWGHTVSVWQTLDLKVDRAYVSGGGWNVGHWHTGVGYPSEFVSPTLLLGRVGAIKLYGASKAAIIRPKIYYPGRFVVLTNQSSAKIDGLVLAPAGAPEWAFYNVACEQGDLDLDLSGWMLDLEGFSPTKGYFYIEPNLFFRGVVRIINCTIPDVVAPSKGVWLPALAGSKPMQFLLDSPHSTSAVADGTVLVRADDPNWSGEVRRVTTQPWKYVSGNNNIIAYTQGPGLPTAGAFEAGRHVHRNTAPASGGVAAWVCTTSGDYAATPPKWAAIPLGAEV